MPWGTGTIHSVSVTLIGSDARLAPEVGEQAVAEEWRQKLELERRRLEEQAPQAVQESTTPANRSGVPLRIVQLLLPVNTRCASSGYLIAFELCRRDEAVFGSPRERAPPESAALGPRGAGGAPASVPDEGHWRETQMNDSEALTIEQDLEISAPPAASTPERTSRTRSAKSPPVGDPTARLLADLLGTTARGVPEHGTATLEVASIPNRAGYPHRDCDRSAQLFIIGSDYSIYAHPLSSRDDVPPRAAPDGLGLPDSNHLLPRRGRRRGGR